MSIWGDLFPPSKNRMATPEETRAALKRVLTTQANVLELLRLEEEKEKIGKERGDGNEGGS